MHMEKEMTTHSSILAWEIPWMEEPGRLQSMGSQRDQGLNQKVTVSQTGCIGICQFEPVVEVYEAGKEKVTYVRMTAEKAKEVVEKHLKSGNIIAEYTITNDRLIGG